MTQDSQIILELLTEDARRSAEEMSKLTGFSVAKVKKIVKKLQDTGVILQYTIVTNTEKIPANDHLVKALIEVQIQPMKKTGFERIAKRIAQHQEVEDHFLISGRYDFLIIVRGKSLRDVAAFVSEKLAPVDHVVGTATHFILKRYKEKGVLIDGKGKAGRLAVSL